MKQKVLWYLSSIWLKCVFLEVNIESLIVQAHNTGNSVRAGTCALLRMD